MTPGAEPGNRGRPGVSDLIAGISVALILIPQALAYAEIAGVPSFVGLYAAALPPIAAAIFASSPYLQTGPVAMTALLTFGVLSTMATPFTPEYVALAALLALVVGVIRVLLGMVRVGVIAYFMSQPVLLGFTTGAAILITASQIPKALGVSAAEGEKLLAQAWWAITHPSLWHWDAIVISALTVAVVMLGRRIGPLFPGVLLAVVAGIAYSTLTGYDGAVVGDIPTGLPPFGLDLPWGSVWMLLLPGAVIALVGFAEPAAIARAFAVRDRQRWDPNREFISQGAANLASGFSGGFPVGGSFSRSSINRLAGARSRLAGAITGITVFAFLPFAGVLSPLPQAVLAAIVLAAVVGLIRVDRIVALRRYSKPQLLVAAATLVATLVLAPRIDLAVLFSVGMGISVHLWRELNTHVRSEIAGGTLRIVPSGVMYFGSTPQLTETLLDELSKHPEATSVEVDLSRLGRIDYTGAAALKTFLGDCQEAGLETAITGVPQQARRLIDRVFADDAT